VNGEKSEECEFSMQLIGERVINLVTGEQKSLQEFNAVDCHALAGIGNPERFFKLLEMAGLACITHSFPDHYQFQRHDIEFADDKPVLMTEKDAVKCMAFAGKQHWYLPVKAVPDPVFSEQLLNLLKSPLIYEKSKQELICRADRLAFPIRDDIPVMLEDEARELSSEETDALYK
jgi:tetraacyldisaccharide 4'-kinase